MTEEELSKVFQNWSRMGVAFGAGPSSNPPDPEQLLLDTAKACPDASRLFICAVTWLVEYGQVIDANRLVDMSLQSLSPEEQATLGLLLETAVEHKASRHLISRIGELAVAPTPNFLFKVDQRFSTERVAQTATPTSRRWGRWMQAFELKTDALRSHSYVLEHNPEIAGRLRELGDNESSAVGDSPHNQQQHLT